jgi:hypothetical protein
MFFSLSNAKSDLLNVPSSRALLSDGVEKGGEESGAAPGGS